MRNIIISIFCCIFLLFACGTGSSNFTLVESNSDILGSSAELTQSIGIETLGGVFTPLIINGTKAPYKISNVFSTATDNQNQITLKLYRGNKELVKDNTFLGTYIVNEIPPAPRGKPQIEITVGVKKKDIYIAAINLETGNTMNIIKVECNSQQMRGADGVKIAVLRKSRASLLFI